MTNVRTLPSVRRDQLIEYTEGAFRTQFLEKLRPESVVGAALMLRYTIRLEGYRAQNVFRVEVWLDERGWTEVWSLDSYEVEHHNFWTDTKALKVANRAIETLGAHARTILTH